MTNDLKSPFNQYKITDCTGSGVLSTTYKCCNCFETTASPQQTGHTLTYLDILVFVYCENEAVCTRNDFEDTLCCHYTCLYPTTEALTQEELEHTVDTEFSVTIFFFVYIFLSMLSGDFHVMSDILVKIFVDISSNICGLFLLWCTS